MGSASNPPALQRRSWDKGVHVYTAGDEMIQDLLTNKYAERSQKKL
jgi:hypothetical protein